MSHRRVIKYKRLQDHVEQFWRVFDAQRECVSSVKAFTIVLLTVSYDYGDSDINSGSGATAG